ncbi:RNA/RNP complex-1-interacting phosphatase [Stylophora pistillata]|uniref:RNA/RNP complex-1-interacting phosphatase n=1 Tax=Stylophora pistillata TaxID=50429 RepID=A0A2B4RJL3_STYPI|nr:RNA/RNP complex-1-interacting phosphatase [Stylophora pistillata]
MAIGPVNYRYNINLQDDNVELTDSLKILGVILDERITFKPYIQVQLKKACAKAAAMRKLRKFIPPDVMIRLYKAYVLPHLEYCSPLLLGISNGLKNKLEDTNYYIPRTILGFTPMDLVNHLSQTHIKLGMVVDFTDTYKYYNFEDLSDPEIRYCKIRCAGEKIPNKNVVERFKTYVCTFLKKASDSDSVVGVHCTHGLNRSGYVVCRYLIECRGYTPEDAIKEYGANTFYPEVDYDSDSKMRIFDDLMKYTMQQNDYNSGTQLNPNNFNALFGVIYFDLTAQPEKVTKDPKKLI